MVYLYYQKRGDKRNEESDESQKHSVRRVLVGQVDKESGEESLSQSRAAGGEERSQGLLKKSLTQENKHDIIKKKRKGK